MCSPHLQWIISSSYRGTSEKQIKHIKSSSLFYIYKNLNQFLKKQVISYRYTVKEPIVFTASHLDPLLKNQVKHLLKEDGATSLTFPVNFFL